MLMSIKEKWSLQIEVMHFSLINLYFVYIWNIRYKELVALYHWISSDSKYGKWMLEWMVIVIYLNESRNLDIFNFYVRFLFCNNQFCLILNLVSWFTKITMIFHNIFFLKKMTSKVESKFYITFPIIRMHNLNMKSISWKFYFKIRLLK